jgi:thioredoxin-related protein
MRKALLFIPLMILFITICGKSQTLQPDSAQSVLKAAVSEAKSSGKNVFLIFHASWCSWCRRFESVLDAPKIRKLIGTNYVVVKLDVMERGEKIQALENPGALKVMEAFGGGEKSGIPYYVFLDGNGRMLANSNVMPGKENIGYPGSKEEIAAFIQLLKKTAPLMTPEERVVISDYLKKNTPK